MSVGLPIPSYSQVCRRAKALGKELKRLTRKKITDVVIDSTGLKVYGEGEWKVRQHGASKRRTWRKVHLAVCPDSQEIVLSLLTENSVSDDAVYQQFAPKLPKTVDRVFADGAYDTKECYQASFEQNIDLIAPPQRNAVERANAPPHMQARNDAVRVIDNLEIILGDKEKARKIWKQLKGYHKRSLAETAMFRFKCLFGDRLSARILSTQKAEVYAKCLAMNTMTKLGMPKGEWVVS